MPRPKKTREEIEEIVRRHPDQAWYWNEEWQRMEREADEDSAAGRVTEFEDGESFLAHLRHLDAESEADAAAAPAAGKRD